MYSPEFMRFLISSGESKSKSQEDKEKNESNPIYKYCQFATAPITIKNSIQK